MQHQQRPMRYAQNAQRTALQLVLFADSLFLDVFLGICSSVFVAAFTKSSEFTRADWAFVLLTISFWLFNLIQRQTSQRRNNPFVAPFKLVSARDSGAESHLLHSPHTMSDRPGEGEEDSSTSLSYTLVNADPLPSTSVQCGNLVVQVLFLIIYIVLIPLDDHSPIAPYYIFMLVFTFIRFPTLVYKILLLVRHRQ